MLLAIDVGNTNIVLGVMDDMNIILDFRIETQSLKTSDEFGVAIVAELRHRGITPQEMEGAIIASVVPNVTQCLDEGINKHLKIKVVIVRYGVGLGIDIKTDTPEAIGADRIVNSIAAFQIYGGPCLAIDFGTATTYDIVNGNGEFIGGLITAGIKMCADAMYQGTAQLPCFVIKKPSSILDCKNTISSMQAGLVYGYIGQVEYIVNKIREEMNCLDMKVIATGGLATIIKGATNVIDVYDEYLTLKGLAIIYKKSDK